jgi:hypothetical protein
VHRQGGGDWPAGMLTRKPQPWRLDQSAIS